MKIGLIGVGKWGYTLADKFRAAGAEIAAHDRSSDGAMGNRFGPRVPWQEMMGDLKIDAVVAATPPDVTKAIFHACQTAKKPCLLTKPLLIDRTSADQLSTTTYVDYVHLFSPLWRLLLEEFDRGVNNISAIRAVSTGAGPIRAFPAHLDYGPHALSLVLDAVSRYTGSGFVEVGPHQSSFTKPAPGIEELCSETKICGIPTTIKVGNNGPRVTAFSALFLEGWTVSYVERGRSASLTLGSRRIVAENHDPLARLVESFLWDTARGIVKRGLTIDSATIASMLEDARHAAELPGAG
jgi:hypothetical protein